MSMPHLSWDDFIILWAFIMHREAKQRGWAFGLIAIIRIQKSDCQVLSLVNRLFISRLCFKIERILKQYSSSLKIYE